MQRPPALPGATGLIGLDGQPLRRDASYSGTSYKGAAQTRALDSWNPGLGSADADLQFEADTARGRARDLERNEGQVVGALSTRAHSVVGAGLTCIPDPDWVTLGKTKEGADDWRRKVRAKARMFFESTDCDATGVDNFGPPTFLLLSSSMLNGGALALPLYLPDRPGRQTSYGTCFQLVEIDRLSNPIGGGVMGSRTLKNGVHVDPDTGQALGYHIRTEHPGELYPTQPRWEYVPAFTRWGRRRAIHLYDCRRIGQTTGISMLATVIPEFKDLSEYKQAELRSQLGNAIAALIVKSKMIYEKALKCFTSPESYFEFCKKNRPKLDAGAPLFLAPGDEAESFSPNRNAANFDLFTKSTLRQIFAGLDMPFEVGARDFGGMNYSSARTALLEAWRVFSTQRQWLIGRWCDPCYEAWFEEAVFMEGSPTARPRISTPRTPTRPGPARSGSARVVAGSTC